MSETTPLDENKLFAHMDAEQIKRVIGCAQPPVREYETGEIIAYQNEPLDHLIVILSGSLDLFKEDYSGSRSLVGQLGPNDVYGQTVIFSDNPINPLIVQTAAPSKLMFLPQTLFYRKCSNACLAHQLVIKNMLSLLAQQATLLDRKIDYLTAGSLRCKVSRYLLEEYHKNGSPDYPFPISLNREALAEYLDVQRPSLSRELIRLKEEGYIDYHRSTFRLLDVKALENFALEG